MGAVCLPDFTEHLDKKRSKIKIGYFNIFFNIFNIFSILYIEMI